MPAAKVYLIEDGYGIRGLEPPGLAAYPAEIRRQFWGWVGEAGLRQKDKDLARGLDKDGKPLRPISAETRKHRRSAMTPSGRGDPSAPPLEPGWQKSRVRSLLTAKAFEDHCEFWWKYDPHSGDSFARILEGQRAMGRDVFGLSPAGLKRVQAEAWTKWEKWKKGGPVPLTKEPRLQAVKVPQVGSTNLEHAVGGAGFTDFVKVGQHSGFQTIEAWQSYFRDSAPARLPGRAVNPPAVSPISGPRYNRLLGHIWGRTRADGGPGRAAKPKPAKPTEPKRQRAAMAPVTKQVTFDTHQQVYAWIDRSFPNLATKPDIDRITPENWSVIASQMETLLKAFPGVASRLRDFGATDGGPGAIAYAARRGKELMFNPRWFNDPKKVTKEFRANVKSGFHPLGVEQAGGVRYYVTHEFGHLVDDLLDEMDPAKQKELYALFSKPIEAGRKSSDLDPAKAGYVSQYAATDQREAFAEAFAAAVWRKDDRNTVIAAFKRILGL